MRIHGSLTFTQVNQQAHIPNRRILGTEERPSLTSATAGHVAGGPAGGESLFGVGGEGGDGGGGEVGQ